MVSAGQTWISATEATKHVLSGSIAPTTASPNKLVSVQGKSDTVAVSWQVAGKASQRATLSLYDLQKLTQSGES